MTTTTQNPNPSTADTAPDGFLGGLWRKEINVRAFIQLN